MPDLLLELFSEEIPARMQEIAADHLKLAFPNALAATNLMKVGNVDCQSFVTPRRLAVIVKNLLAVQPDIVLEKKGPKTSAPQASIDGFLRSSNLTLDMLEKRMVGKDETYFAINHVKGRPTAHILKEIIEKILTEFPWPKSMRWGSRNETWVRPLHSILCVFDGKVVPVEFAGIKSSNVTYGHRFLAPDAITISSPEEYTAKLTAAKVIAHREERKAEILKQANTLATGKGLTLKEDAGLLSEVTGLVEWPTVLMGRIDIKYMDLPPEVLVSEMRAHQKYFALISKDGYMSDQFLITSNMITTDGGKAVIAGNERVLRARLSDGRFFWDQDRKKNLSDWAEGLKGVTFHAKIGTIAEKVARVTKLASTLSEYVKGADKKLVERAASLCKADLVTGMVGEFPELQGVMGRYYALHQKEDASVADAIRDHYLPLGPDSAVPTKPVSICVALADKLDTLISMFAAGEKPTGSKDPFALRRSALGIIRIILDNKIRINFASLIFNHIGVFDPTMGETQKQILTLELLGFFSDRLKVQLKEQGITHDLIAAVFATGEVDFVRLLTRVRGLEAFLISEDGKNLLSAYKRASNIVEAEEKKDKCPYKMQPQIHLLKLDEEKYLYKVLGNLLPAIDVAIQEESFVDLIEMAASMRKSIDAFFDKVLVNDNEPEVRINRLCLLSQFRTALDKIANFALIER